MNRKDYFIAATLGAGAAGLYLAFLSKSYVFEGLARAMPMEIGAIRGLFNGNHLAYGPTGFCFHSALKILGWTDLAVTSLQIMDSLLGASGLFMYFLTLRRLSADRPQAVAWSCVLGLSLGHWRWSIEAENYIFSSFLLCLNFSFLVFWNLSKVEVSPLKAAALHVLALSGHIVNTVFAGAWLAYLLADRGKPGRADAYRYLAAFVVLALSLYGGVLALVVRPSSIAEALEWFLGSASGGRGVLNWHGHFGWDSLWTWAKMTTNIFISSLPPFEQPPAWTWSAPISWAARLMCVGFILLALLRLKKIIAWQCPIAIVCLAWLTGYFLIFTSWEPGTMVYRVPDLMPLVTLFFMATKTLPRRFCFWSGAGFALLLGLGNFGAEIYPRSFTSNNHNLARMEFIKVHTGESDWIAGEGGTDELYIPYFAQRTPLLIGFFNDRPADLAKRIDSLLASGRGVFITSKTLESSGRKLFFASYRLELTAARNDGFSLYRVHRADHR